MQVFATYSSRLFSGLLVAGIGVLFFAQLRALVRNRIDYPIQDDWRYYFVDAGMPEELSLAWLMRPAQDTLHISGKLLDWLYFHFIAHDFSSLAAASFGFSIGVWLLCAVGLCWLAGRGRPLVRASSLVAFSLPLAAAPYWVSASPKQWLEPVIAYHQMLPVVGLFALGLFAAAMPRRPLTPLQIIGVCVTTLFFALAYSSGAVVLVVFGGALVSCSMIFGLSHRMRPSADGPGASPDPATPQLAHRRLAGIGGVILAVALLSLAAHVLVPWMTYGANPVVVMRDHANTLPWESHYWQSFLGLFDRAVLSTAVNRHSFLRGAAVAIAVIAPLVPLLVLVVRGRIEEGERSVAVVIIGIVLSVLVYGALVAYGRADFGHYYFARDYPLDHRAARYTHARFFYWWIAAILPLVVMAWGLVAERLWSRRASAGVAAALAALLLWPKEQDPHFPGSFFAHWDYSARYSRDAAETFDLIKSDMARLRKVKVMPLRFRQRVRIPEAERNPSFLPFIQPPRMYYERADAAGAKFVRRWNLDPGPSPDER